MTTDQEILKQFDEKFGDENNDVEGNKKILKTGIDLEDAFSFLSSALSQARADEREKVREYGETLRINSHCERSLDDAIKNTRNGTVDLYNKFLSSLTSNK